MPKLPPPPDIHWASLRISWVSKTVEAHWDCLVAVFIWSLWSKRNGRIVRLEINSVADVMMKKIASGIGL